jgi:hypothetical protein
MSKKKQKLTAKEKRLASRYIAEEIETEKRRMSDGAHEVRVPGVPETRFWSYVA